MSQSEFVSTFLSTIRPGDRILDIGGGRGDFAQHFVDRDANVTIVDPQAAESTDDRIDVQRMAIEAFCAVESTDVYDAIFARNVLQFLDRSFVDETLIPWMTAHLRDGGVLAIETFSQEPDPPFPRPIPTLYELSELSTHFLAWPELLAKQFDFPGMDMNGTPRRFFTVDLIVRKGKS